MLHVIQEIAIIVVAVRPLVLLPFTMGILEPISKVSNIAGSVLPPVLTESVWSSLSVSPDVDVAVGEDVRALPVLQAVDPLALVPVTVLPLVDAIPFDFAVLPLSDVLLSIGPLIMTLAADLVVFELTLVRGSIFPLELTWAFFLSILKSNISNNLMILHLRSVSKDPVIKKVHIYLSKQHNHY